jgi:PAS domain S-box-containing protein
MDVRFEDPAQEVKHLQRCLNDIVSLLALPAIWTSSPPSQIVQTLLDALLRMLSLEFVYARLEDSTATEPMQIVRVANAHKLKLSAPQIAEVVNDRLRNESQKLSALRTQLGEKDISIFSIPLGVHGEIGTLVAGSDRTDFPAQTENLVLSVAANQASIALREAALLRKQKRITEELDEVVAERTAELAASNEELRVEIAERKLNEEKLWRSEERWRSIFENSAVGVIVTDLNGRFIATNPVFEKMLGYTGDEFQQLTFLDITHEESVDHNRRLVAELLDGKRQQFQIEQQYRSKDGKAVWTRNNVSIIPGTERVPRFLIALSEDITQQKLSEEALAKARLELTNVAKITSLGVLTASIAHEVNQPLSGIITNASTCLRMLSADPPNVDGARETARRTIRDGNRASDVITRLRTLYSKKEPSLEWMDLNEATREVVALSLSEIQRSGVVLRDDLAEDLPAVLGDRIQLQQVILNLLRNAADAMSTVDDRPKEVVIKTEREEGNQVRLSVTDSGAGFAGQGADKIFEAFYTTKPDGMGIGLSISRSIVEAHEGRLWATPNDGAGSTFSFVIPCAPGALADSEIPVTRIDPSTDAA